MEKSSFAGKVVLVTGANSGIGEAIAVAFDAAGATQSSMRAACQRHLATSAAGSRR